MGERPILFSGPMVRRILGGSKTVTRRIVSGENAPDPGRMWDDCLCHEIHPDDTPCVICYARFRRCPASAGDRLWVRETWRTVAGVDSVKPVDLRDDAPIWYDADDPDGERRAGDFGLVFSGSYQTEDGWTKIGKGRPAIFMQRRFARLALDVVSVRAERLHDITDEDAVREGIRRFPDIPRGTPSNDCRWSWQDAPPDTDHCLSTPRWAFANLWNHLHGAGAWDANPWVWRIEFTARPGRLAEVPDAGS